MFSPGGPSSLGPGTVSDPSGTLVKAFQLFQDLSEQFGAVLGTTGAWALVKTVQPVTQVDLLTEDVVMDRTAVNLDVTGGTFIPVHTVPNGEVWTLYATAKEATAGSTGVVITSDGGSTSMRLEVSSTIESIVLLAGLPMQPGGIVGLLATDNVADSARNLGIWVAKRTISS